VAGGAHCAGVAADMACLLCMMMSQLRHADVIYIRVSHMGRVIWYSGRVSHPGEEDAWGASARVGRRLAGE